MLVLLCAIAGPSLGQDKTPARPLPTTPHFADYDSEPRRADGHVDGDALLTRLKELHVTTYYWLVWHARTDWDDLKLFLPKAAQANIQVWVYLVPPTESPPQYGDLYSEPFRLDYGRWAEEIARLSLQHTNLTAWVIDDFYANHEFFTPAVLRDLRHRAKGINPRLAFLPLMYFGEIRRAFIDDYREVIDGVVVAYPQDRDEINHAWSLLNDAAVVLPGELNHPWSTSSQPGDFVRVSQSATVGPDRRQRLRFRERDDFTAGTAGYHFKQLLVNETVVWEADVAGGTNAWGEVTVDVTAAAQGKTNLALAFRLLDKQARQQLRRALAGKGFAGGRAEARGRSGPAAEVAGVPARSLRGRVRGPDQAAATPLPCAVHCHDGRTGGRVPDAPRRPCQPGADR